MYPVPTLVTVNAGAVGGVLSSGSDTLTVPLLASVLPLELRARAENEYVAPAWRGGCGYFHVTLVCVPGTEISRPQLSRSRYDAVPVTAFQANETLHDVLPVTLRLSEAVGGFGGFLASADSVEPGAVMSRAASF
jgi:hypothetical protein